MEVDHQGNICASELRIYITAEAEMRAGRVGQYRDDGYLRAARDLGLEVEPDEHRITVSVVSDYFRDQSVVTYRDNWQLPTRR